MSGGVEYRIYSRRWLVLATYMCVNIVMQSLWATFFSVTTQAWKFYGFSDRVSGEASVSLLSIVIMTGMLILSIPASAIFSVIGWYKAMSIASVLMAVCAVARGIFGTGYSAVLICTVGMACAQPFILNAMGLMTSKWFPPKERGLANGFCVCTVTVGAMVSQLGFPWVQKTFGLDIPSVLKIYGIMAVIAAIFFITAASEAPKLPPCDEKLMVRDNYRDGIKRLVKNKNFILGMLIYLALNGGSLAFTTFIEPFMNYLNGGRFDSIFIATFGMVISILGISGTILITLYTDHNNGRRRLPSIRLCMALSAVGLVLFMCLHIPGLLFAAAALYGFSCNGVMPVGLVYGCESGYPVSEGTTGSLMQWIGNMGGIIMLSVINTAFNGNHLISMLFILGVTVFGFVISLIAREKSEQERMI